MPISYAPSASENLTVQETCNRNITSSDSNELNQTNTINSFTPNPKRLKVFSLQNGNSNTDC